MPTENQVWSIADRLREKPERVSLRTVRAALPYGGSFRDIGPHVASWKAQRAYKPGIELSALPEHVQTELARAAAGLWEAAMQEATRILAKEREQASMAAAADRELRDDALAAADAMVDQVEGLKSEIARLHMELEQAKAQANGFLEKLLASRSEQPGPDDARKTERSRSREF